MGLFSKTVEVWDVKTNTSWSEEDVDMGGQTHITTIRSGEPAIAKISSKGNVTITFTELKGGIYHERMKVWCKENEDEYNNFDWIKQTKGEPNPDRMKNNKSSLTGVKTLISADPLA